MTDPAVVAESVSYRIGRAELVSGVSLLATKGEFVAILGPNGAGKSTFLHLLSGGLRPSRGTVDLFGVDPGRAHPSELAKLRSVLSQRRPTDIPFSVAQVVGMGRFPYRSDPANSAERDKEAISSAMARTDTERFARRSFATLSGGEQIRASLARVIAQDTPIVLLDEPTAALDMAHQERVLSEMQRMAKEEKTVVAVLHDLNAAAGYADRLVLMNRGTVVASGTARQVLMSERLTEVYRQEMVVVDHPFRDCPLVLPGG